MTRHTSLTGRNEKCVRISRNKTYSWMYYEWQTAGQERGACRAMFKNGLTIDP